MGRNILADALTQVLSERAPGQVPHPASKAPLQLPPLLPRAASEMELGTFFATGG